MSALNFLISKTIMHVPGPVVSIFAKSYIAGQELSDAVRVTRDFNKQGIMTTIDLLGEFIKTKDQAKYFKDRCIEILDTINKEKLDSNLSIKPTQMGLSLDDDFALENIREIVAYAASINNFVRVDMEDTPNTDKTLKLHTELKQEFGRSIGTVLQSYLRRTPADIDNLDPKDLNIRLCKGIYNEPRELAYKDPYIVNQNFIHCLDKLFAKGAYVGIATHDEKLIFESLRLIEKYNLKKQDYEFQMLLGVDEQLRKIIAEEGHRLRVYVPFGKDWLPYSKRRLKENPKIATHALRQMFGIHGHN
ncbi:MAG: proline dehydrogenase [Flexistipes sinusarabici]|uniref:proline dehydrogenase n=1 Tax=Flexistipes sinusarabici TaxID=2352 RepID=A0A5D0MTC2_FLESI|nr:proline dehydrogenase family protein [Flexistipes sinusarabici]TYB35363.1 MAG: proline dehydrogenase [Flexistipes sinusarabici]